jgi:phosphoribosylanthranilate isomerase
LDTRIKICGITRVADAQAAVAAGAHALGLNFAPISPRRIDLATAAEISGSVAGEVCRVGLFVDPEQAQVTSVLDAVELDVLQFHGEESAEFCRSFSLPYLKAFRVAGPFDGEAAAASYPDACALLLDAYVPGIPGGTGSRFELAHWPVSAPLPLILSGGLDSSNVAAALAEVRTRTGRLPFAVDLSGGVESGTKGVKDHQKIRDFVAAVTAACA